MKKHFINKFPGLLATVLIGYGCYEAGKLNVKKQLLKSTRICTNHVLKNIDKYTLSKFYSHKSTLGNTWRHAEAMIEQKWAKCFREELYK